MAIDKAVDSAELDAALEGVGNAIREKNGSTAKYGLLNGEMEDAVRAISTGVQVQTKTGSFTYNNGNAEINVGFSPDVFSIDTGTTYEGYRIVVSVDFHYGNNVSVMYGNTNNTFFALYATRNGNSVRILSQSMTTGDGATGSMSYRAYKFTE